VSQAVPLRINLIAGLLLFSLLGTRGSSCAQVFSEPDVEYHSIVPLGAEGFDIQGANRKIYLLASAENGSFEGMRRVKRGARRLILAGDGTPLRSYPRFLHFRVTATARGNENLGAQTSPIPPVSDLNSYILKLGFRVKIFHALDYTLLEPQSVDLVGMPADVPYDERIFRLTFELDNMPLEDRLVLEILTPEGNRLCKFHLELL